MAYPSFRDDAKALEYARQTAKRTAPAEYILDASGGIVLDPASTADLEIHTADGALEAGAAYLCKFIGANDTDIAYVRLGSWATGAFVGEADNEDYPLVDTDEITLVMPDDGLTTHGISALFPNADAATRLSIMPVTRLGDDAL